MNSRFFVDRPVFASVISIVIFLAGIMGMRALPIEQYPELVPPEVVVAAAYPGASAETLPQTVSAPLEEQINGVENMIYMQSTNSSSGTASVTVTFASGTDPDQATERRLPGTRRFRLRRHRPRRLRHRRLRRLRHHRPRRLRHHRLRRLRHHRLRRRAHRTRRRRRRRP